MGARRLYSTVTWILSMQILTMGVVSVAIGVLAGWAEAKSALLGGVTAFLPNAYFAAKFGRVDKTKTTKQIVRSFYVGETIKIILTAALFFLIFQLPDIAFIPLFIGFVSVLMVFWFALLRRDVER
jgi:ATP synthase protein I